MYQTSTTYKQKVYEPSTRHNLKVMAGEQPITPLLSFKKTFLLFGDDELCLGSTPSQSISFKVHKDNLWQNHKEFYVTTGIDNEVVPIGYFTLESIEEVDRFTVSITAEDYMTKFEPNYDGSELIKQKGYATMLEVLQDLCNKAGVTLGTTSFLNQNKKIAVYDSSISGRVYLSYIAEQAGCFAMIGRDGKLYLRKLGQDIATIPSRLFQTYKWGELCKISRVSYEDGIQDYKFGNIDNNTLWISGDNMFIVDQNQVENIYNTMKDLECYGFTGTSIIDPSIDIGDFLDINGKKILFQGEMQYLTKFKASISSKIRIKAKEETTRTVVSDKAKIRRVQSEINQIDGKITQLVEETGEHEDRISKAEQDIEGFRQNVGEVADYQREKEGFTKVDFEEAIKKVQYELKGNGIYENNLFPIESLYPSESLYPNQAII